jgi:hypothetical protein
MKTNQINLVLAFCILSIPALFSCDKKNESQSSQSVTPASQSVTPAPINTQAIEAKPTAVSNQIAQVAEPTLSAEIQEARELAKIAFQYSKDSPPLAKLIADKQAIYTRNHEAINKKISEVSPSGKEIIEKESTLLKNLLDNSKMIQEKKGVAVDDLIKKQEDIQNELGEIQKEKRKVGKQIYYSADMKDLMQANAQNIKDIDDKITKLVAEIKAKKEVIE